MGKWLKCEEFYDRPLTSWRLQGRGLPSTGHRPVTHSIAFLSYLCSFIVTDKLRLEVPCADFTSGVGYSTAVYS